MPGLPINGGEHEIPGLRILNFNDDRRLFLAAEDGCRRRTKWVRMQINHTTKGIPGGGNRTPQTIRPGMGPDRGKDFDVASYWQKSSKQSAAHGIVDTDGSVAVIADLFLTATYHAGNRGVNDKSIGWEMYQDGDGSIWQSTIDAMVAVNVATCILFGMQMQYHWPYRGGPIDRLMKGGDDCVGVFGHRDVTSNRGLGDPGDAVFAALERAGFERFDFGAGEDKEAWRDRQDRLAVAPDGVPGPQTVAALREAGYRHGIYALGKGDDSEDIVQSVRRILCKALGC